VGGERSPSWLASLRFTSVEHLPTHSHFPASRRLYSGDPGNSSKKPLDAGVLVCEALRERSEQRTNKYPEVGGCVALGDDRRLGPARTENGNRDVLQESLMV